MSTIPQISVEAIDKAVDDVLSQLLPGASAEPHLARAVIAEQISAAAALRSRHEVASALESDGTSWDDVAHAFGISVHDAQFHYRTRPMGLPE